MVSIKVAVQTIAGLVKDSKEIIRTNRHFLQHAPNFLMKNLPKGR